jgi:hypothetical protein
MRQNKPVSCYSILQNTNASVLERGRQLARLNDLVQQLLPDDLAAHCQVLNYRDGTLLLAAGSAARATRLRFIASELQSVLQQELPIHIETVKIRVLPESPQPTPAVRPAQTLSAASARLLAQTAQTMDHPGLQEALYRIAANMRKN